MSSNESNARMFPFLPSVGSVCKCDRILFLWSLYIIWQRSTDVIQISDEFKCVERDDSLDGCGLAGDHLEGAGNASRHRPADLENRWAASGSLWWPHAQELWGVLEVGGCARQRDHGDSRCPSRQQVYWRRTWSLRQNCNSDGTSISAWMGPAQSVTILWILYPLHTLISQRLSPYIDALGLIRLSMNPIDSQLLRMRKLTLLHPLPTFPLDFVTGALPFLQ